MFVLNSSGAGEYNLLINDELTVGANTIIPISSSYEFNGNYFTVSCKFTFIPTQADPAIAFSALYNIAPFVDQDQISGCGSVSLVTASTGSDGNVKISSSSSSSSVVFSFVTPGYDSIQVYECEAIFSYFTAPLSLLSFISTWTTTDTITLPLSSTGTYNFLINWGDGNVDHITAYDQAEVTHTYSAAGNYTLVITGVCEGWTFKDVPDSKDKINEIVQWGNFKMGDGTLDGGYFYQCTNLIISAIDIPDLTGVFSFNGAFQQTSIVNIPLLDQWITSDIANMSSCFAGCTLFVGDGIEAWDMRNVNDISYMFFECEVFNAVIGLWVTSALENMSNTFDGCSAFNQNLNAWDVSLVTNFNYTFNNCIVFNGVVSTWITDSALGMSNTFSGCAVFDQDLSGWNVANVSDATSMLDYTRLSITNYDALLISWAAQTVQNAVQFGAVNLTYSSAAVSAHDTLTNSPNDWIITDSGLQGASFITKWDTTFNMDATVGLPLVSTGIYDFIVHWGDGNSSHITTYDDIGNLHIYAENGVYTVTIYGQCEGWNFENGLYGIPNAIIDVLQWGNVKIDDGTSLGGYFKFTTNLTQISALDAPDLSNTTSLNEAFYQSGIINIANLNSWGMSTIMDTSFCFYHASSFEGIGIEGLDMSSVINVESMFEGASSFNGLIGLWTTTNFQNMTRMLKQASIFNQSVAGIDTSNVTTLEGTFQQAVLFEGIGIENWITSNVITLDNTFDGNGLIMSFNGNVSDWDVSNVASMYQTFPYCYSFNRPLNWDTSSCATMFQTFVECINFNQDMPYFITNTTTNVTNFLSRCYAFNGQINTWDLSGITSGGFGGGLWEFMSDCTSFNQSVAGLNPVNAGGYHGAFQGCTALDQDFSSWPIVNITDADQMFDGVTLSNANYNALLISWAAQSVQNGVTFDGGNSHYDGAGIAAHNTLTGTYGWVITDGGTP